MGRWVVGFSEGQGEGRKGGMRDRRGMVCAWMEGCLIGCFGKEGLTVSVDLIDFRLRGNRPCLLMFGSASGSLEYRRSFSCGHWACCA